MKAKALKTVLSILICLGYFVSPAWAQSAREIMIKVDKVSREAYASSIQKMKLSTCKYGIKGKKMVCVEKPRIKLIESVQKDTGPNGKDSKAVSIILEPVGEKGISMLSYDYDDPNRDADTWLYLSALGKVKRMISGSDDDDAESGSFFGTEFSVEDMENRKIEDYSYKMLKETKYQKRPVWIVEAVPTPKRARKTRYGKSVTWIDKERYIVLKVQLYNRYGRLHKRLTMRKIKNIDNVWVARSVAMNNLITKRVTRMSLLALAFNVQVSDSFLTKRTLTDFAFRERELARLRKELK